MTGWSLLVALTVFTGTVAPGSPCEATGLAPALQAQREGLCRLKGSTEPDRVLLREILESPELGRAKAGRASGWWKELMGRVLEWLGISLTSTGAQSFAEWTRFAVLAAATAVLLGLGWRLRKARSGRAAKARLTSPSSDAGFELAPPEDHLARARRLVDAQARSALRESLLALLSSLERANLSRPDRVRTNRELARELDATKAPEGVPAEVGRLLENFDRAFYSLEPVETPQARAFLSDVERVTARLSEVAA
jgi:hypothetical protein